MDDALQQINHARAARCLLRAHRYGALSTLSVKFDGHPFGSIAPYLTDHDGSVLLFLSSLAEHSKNLMHDPRISLITHDQNDARIQTQGRITLLGEAHPLEGRERHAARWLRHFPENEPLFALGDFGFYRITPQAVRHVAGFGQARWHNSHFTVAPHPLMAEEASLLAHLNSTAQGALRAICRNRLQLDADDVRLVGLDCDGLTLAADGRMVRCDFAQAATDARAAEVQFALLAEPA